MLAAAVPGVNWTRVKIPLEAPYDMSTGFTYCELQTSDWVSELLNAVKTTP